jgi:hypothetical protein
MTILTIQGFFVHMLTPFYERLFAQLQVDRPMKNKLYMLTI